MPIKIDEAYMKESLRAFIEETLEEEGFDKPDIFIIMVAQGDDITFHSSSNSHKRTLEVLNRAVMLHKEAKLEAGMPQNNGGQVK